MENKEKMVKNGESGNCSKDTSYRIVKTGELSDDELDGVAGGATDYGDLAQIMDAYNEDGVVYPGCICNQFERNATAPATNDDNCTTCAYFSSYAVVLGKCALR